MDVKIKLKIQISSDQALRMCFASKAMRNALVFFNQEVMKIKEV